MRRFGEGRAAEVNEAAETRFGMSSVEDTEIRALSEPKNGCPLQTTFSGVAGRPFVNAEGAAKSVGNS